MSRKSNKVPGAPKTFPCSICGEQVTKPKSYAMLNGSRACRTHPEAIEANQKRELIRRDELQKSQKRTKSQNQQFTIIPKVECWHCLKEGVNEKEVFERILINSAKQELFGQTMNFFDPNDPVYKKTREDLNGKSVVKVFPIDHLEEWQIRQLAKGQFEAANLGKLIMLCPECAKNFGFDWTYDVPKLTTDQVANWSVAYSMMKPTIQEIAQKEMDNKIIQKV